VVVRASAPGGRPNRRAAPRLLGYDPPVRAGAGRPAAVIRDDASSSARHVDQRSAEEPDRVSSAPPAKFFVNRGIVSSRTDMHHLLRPLLKQTVSYRYFRGREMADHGTGWVERVVVDEPEASTYFTPLSISLNVDSFEHLEFETRPDQLLVYTLVQGDEQVVLEFAPVGESERSPFEPRQLEFDTTGFVQMELLGLDGRDEE
jgi:hypothetical protein